MSDEKKVEDLEKRIKKLEKSSYGKIRFIIQYLIAPIIVLVFGFFLKMDFEREKMDLEKEKASIERKFKEEKNKLEEMELANRMMDNLFSNDVYKINASKALMMYAFENDELQNAITLIVDEYLCKLVEKSKNNGNIKILYEIYDSASNYKYEKEDKVIKKINEDVKLKNSIDEYKILLQEQDLARDLASDGKKEEALKVISNIQDLTSRDRSIVQPSKVSPLSSYDLKSFNEQTKELEKSITENRELK